MFQRYFRVMGGGGCSRQGQILSEETRSSRRVPLDPSPQERKPQCGVYQRS